MGITHPNVSLDGFLLLRQSLTVSFTAVSPFPRIRLRAARLDQRRDRDRVPGGDKSSRQRREPHDGTCPHLPPIGYPPRFHPRSSSRAPALPPPPFTASRAPPRSPVSSGRATVRPTALRPAARPTRRSDG